MRLTPWLGKLQLFQLSPRPKTSSSDLLWNRRRNCLWAWCVDSSDWSFDRCPWRRRGWARRRPLRIAGQTWHSRGRTATSSGYLHPLWSNKFTQLGVGNKYNSRQSSLERIVKLRQLSVGTVDQNVIDGPGQGRNLRFFSIRIVWLPPAEEYRRCLALRWNGSVGHVGFQVIVR